MYISNRNKIGEIIILGPSGHYIPIFLKSICKSVIITKHNIHFGRYSANHDLHLHLYGMSIPKSISDYEWDLFANKIIGSIFIFDWFDNHSLEKSKYFIQFLSHKFNSPMVLAADVLDKAYPVKDIFIKTGIQLSNHCNFNFYKDNNLASVKNIMVSLLDIIIRNYD
jgi:hypothetical protein